jgi:hypothetical protein
MKGEKISHVLSHRRDAGLLEFRVEKGHYIKWRAHRVCLAVALGMSWHGADIATNANDAASGHAGCGCFSCDFCEQRELQSGDSCESRPLDRTRPLEGAPDPRAGDI